MNRLLRPNRAVKSDANWVDHFLAVRPFGFPCLLSCLKNSIQLLRYLRCALRRLFRRAYNGDTPGAVADFDATQFFARFYVHN